MRALGRVPSRGIPRIGALNDMSYGVRQFVMTDPGGNMIRIGQPMTTEVEPLATPSMTPLERAGQPAYPPDSLDHRTPTPMSRRR